MVKEAEKKLGLTGRSGFARDKLRVVVTRPDQQPLTLVDTPGLISSHNDGREYIDLVKDIVDGCIKKERTLILAVVEASLDPQKQSILTTAKEVDPKGERTFGIITKPDVVEPGSQLEGYWIEKVSNAPGRISEFNFEKGWHVLRNRGVRETGNETSTAERDEAEKRFFTDTSRRWHQIDEKHWGIDSLQTRLRSIYYQHTKKQLPEIEKGILSKLHAAETERDEINTKLEDPAVVWDVYCEERAELATRAKDCVEGIFHDDSSADWSDAYYLRSRIEEEHDEFTQDMEHNGHGLRLPGSDRSLTEDKEAYQAYCQLMLKQTRGRELKESYDPNRLNLLFRLHSKPWNGIARRHLNNAHDRCVAFINRIIDTVLREQLPSLPIRVSETMKDHLKKELVIKRKEAEAELAALELDRRQPAQTQSSGFERRARQLKMGKNYAMLNRIEEENAQQRRAGRTSTTREQNREAENETPTSETPGGPIPLPVNDTWFTPARVGEILAQDSRAEAAAEIGERMIEYYKVSFFGRCLPDQLTNLTHLTRFFRLRVKCSSTTWSSRSSNGTCSGLCTSSSEVTLEWTRSCSYTPWTPRGIRTWCIAGTG